MPFNIRTVFVGLLGLTMVAASKSEVVDADDPIFIALRYPESTACEGAVVLGRIGDCIPSNNNNDLFMRFRYVKKRQLLDCDLWVDEQCAYHMSDTLEDAQLGQCYRSGERGSVMIVSYNNATMLHRCRSRTCDTDCQPLTAVTAGVCKPMFDNFIGGTMRWGIYQPRTEDEPILRALEYDNAACAGTAREWSATLGVCRNIRGNSYFTVASPPIPDEWEIGAKDTAVPREDGDL